jgi:hypothetical protein
VRGGSLWLSPSFHGLQWPHYPRSGIGLSGSVWLDTGYELIRRGNPAEPDTTYQLQQGRFSLRVTPTFSSGEWFVQGQAELIANKDQTLVQPTVADTDDLWIRTGRWGKWDLQIGRFEAWEIYHFGMALDLNTLERRGAIDLNLAAPDIYGVTYAFYRPSGVGNVAFHAYPLHFLRFELLGQVGNENSLNTLAGRPTLILDIGYVKLKVGGEYVKQTAQNGHPATTAPEQRTRLEERTLRGAGAALQFVFDPHVEFGVSGARGLVDHIDSQGMTDAPGSTTTYSVGAFANARLLEDLVLGVGAHRTHLENLHFDEALQRVGDFQHLQAFGALQYLAFGQLYIKLVAAYAKADFAPSFTSVAPFANDMFSARVRFMYLF